MVGLVDPVGVGGGVGPVGLVGLLGLVGLVGLREPQVLVRVMG